MTDHAARSGLPPVNPREHPREHPHGNGRVAADTSGHAHPIHGILSAFPLALFTAALVTDLAYAGTAEMMWANFSIWLIAGGLAMGVLAAVAGIVDALAGRHRQRRIRSWPHGIGTTLMMVLALVNAFVHSRDAWTSVVPTGLVLSAIVALLAIATSWQGFALQTRQEFR